MQSEVFTNARIVVSTSTAAGTRDISNRTMKIELSRQKDDHDDTVMGSTAHTYIMGLEKWSFKTDMIQSFSTSDGGENTNSLFDTLFNLPAASQKFLVTVRKDNTLIRGVNNPEWSGLCVLKGFSPITGGVGDLLKSSVEFTGSSNLSMVTTSS
jgi:hypothetical protein